jgi:hypothetical protein
LSITVTAEALEIAFETKSLRKICESESEAKKQLGDAVSKMLQHRLADLCAASSPLDLVAGRPRTVGGGQFMTVDLCDGYRVVFDPNHVNNPMTKTNDVDWPRISRIKLLRIERDDA